VLQLQNIQNMANPKTGGKTYKQSTLSHGQQEVVSTNIAQSHHSAGRSNYIVKFEHE
jgi:hypothetical protein